MPKEDIPPTTDLDLRDEVVTWQDKGKPPQIGLGELKARIQPISANVATSATTNAFKFTAESDNEEAHRHRIENRDHIFKILLITSILGILVHVAATTTSADDRKWSFGLIGSLAGYAIKGKI